jgi:tripartite-type tricarboxylate transporter receptor subunit TctC
MIGQQLSERLGQPFIIENRPGGGGNIGTESVVRAAPDGYALLLVSIANATQPALSGKLNYNFLADIVPVSGIVRIPNTLVVHPSVPANTTAEFVTYAQAHPGKINMASAGNGSAPHLAGELFKVATGVDLMHIPYRGATPAMTDLLAGQVQIMFASTASAVQHVRAGKLRALAVTSRTRWEGLPDVPTVSEFVPNFETTFWAGLGAPRDTPGEIVDLLNKAVDVALAHPKVRAQLLEIGGAPMRMSPSEFASFIREETSKWAKVIHHAKIKSE